MFTGLIQSRGVVASNSLDKQGGLTLTVQDELLPTGATLGESISVSGTCLTVVRFDPTSLTFQVGPETLARTTLGKLQSGDAVNLERSLRVGDTLGGHFVSGHVDCVGTIAAVQHSGEWEMMTFAFPPEFDELIVPKGSIAIDGISLTVVRTQPGELVVMLIPHTLSVTTLGLKHPGDVVNLEFDLLAKHVRKLVKGI